MNILKTVAIGLAILPGAAFAAGDLSRANIQEVAIEMGTNDDGMYFTPSEFKFETGVAYKWVLTNVDDIKHEVSIGEMKEKIFTRKIEIVDAEGELVAEVKGSIHEVEVGPHQSVEWYFVPVQTGEAMVLACELEGHAEAGMVGTVTLY